MARTGIRATPSSRPQVPNVPAWVGVERRASRAGSVPLIPWLGRADKLDHVTMLAGSVQRGSKGTRHGDRDGAEKPLGLWLLEESRCVPGMCVCPCVFGGRGLGTPPAPDRDLTHARHLPPGDDTHHQPVVSPEG